MVKLAVLKFEGRFNTGGRTGEIAISPTFIMTYAVLGEENRCVETLPHVRSPSSSLVKHHLDLGGGVTRDH